MAAGMRRRLDVRIAGNLSPETPTMDSLPTLPRRRRSNKVRPTTPTFLSEVDAPPPTKPVVYSPVPTWHPSSASSLEVATLGRATRSAGGKCNAVALDDLASPVWTKAKEDLAVLGEGLPSTLGAAPCFLSLQSGPRSILLDCSGSCD